MAIAREVHALQSGHVEERARARTARLESDERRADRLERHRRVAQDYGAPVGAATRMSLTIYSTRP